MAPIVYYSHATPSFPFSAPPPRTDPVHRRSTPLLPGPTDTSSGTRALDVRHSEGGVQIRLCTQLWMNCGKGRTALCTPWGQPGDNASHTSHRCCSDR
ncbi:hypothetical protein EBESD8_7480 [Rhodococcus aetherivorans]|nr:hypothetical protein EBESD8_7480 [Rhodococcus aetherivorans]